MVLPRTASDGQQSERRNQLFSGNSLTAIHQTDQEIQKQQKIREQKLIKMIIARGFFLLILSDDYDYDYD
jgi:hypothetical protein